MYTLILLFQCGRELNTELVPTSVKPTIRYERLQNRALLSSSVPTMQRSI